MMKGVLQQVVESDLTDLEQDVEVVRQVYKNKIERGEEVPEYKLIILSLIKQIEEL